MTHIIKAGNEVKRYRIACPHCEKGYAVVEAERIAEQAGHNQLFGMLFDALTPRKCLEGCGKMFTLALNMTIRGSLKPPPG